MNSIAFRRHLHRHPELSFEEHQTAAFIGEQLTEAGIAWRPIAQTGILATIRGRATKVDDRRAVVLRADIDALPIDEQTGLDYASERAGVMHACGHDMHAAMLYGTLCELAAEADFAGTVISALKNMQMPSLSLNAQQAAMLLGGAGVLLFPVVPLKNLLPAVYLRKVKEARDAQA